MSRLYRKKGRKKKGKKRGAQKLPFEKKRASSKKIKNGHLKGRFFLDENKGWQQTLKPQNQKICQKKGKKQPFGEKRASQKNKKGKKGHIKNHVKKKRAHQKKTKG